MDQSQAYWKERGVHINNEQVALLLRKCANQGIRVGQNQEFTQAYEQESGDVNNTTSYHVKMDPKESSMVIALALMLIKKVEHLKKYIEEPEYTKNYEIDQWNKIPW
jgi:hypothetical protein